MRRALIKFEWKYKFCLWKSYFDIGFSYFNYIKPFFYLLVGYDVLINKSFLWLILTAIGGFIVSVAVGYFWYKTDLARASAEVGNRYNLLNEEIRKKFNPHAKETRPHITLVYPFENVNQSLLKSCSTSIYLYSYLRYFYCRNGK